MFRGVLDFEDNYSGDKIFDLTSSCLFLVKCVMSTLKNSSYIYVIKHIITKL